MKDDYLWNKAGEIDQEIERLENVLQVYRYEPSNAPLFSAPAIKPKKSFREKLQRWLILTSPVAASLIVLGLFFGLSQLSGERIQQTTENVAETIETSTAQNLSSAQSESVVEQTEQFEKRNASAESVSIYQRANQRIRLRKTKNVFPHKSIVYKRPNMKRGLKLTQEELYAYEQLMKALQITNSKFALIQKKIRGEKAEKQNVRS